MFSLLMTVALAIQGNWIKSCEMADNNEDWLREKMVISGETWTRETYFNEDAYCRGSDYLTLKQVWQTTVSEHYADMVTESVAIRPETQEIVEAFNLMSYCGLSNWKLKEYNEVTGKTCGDRTFQVPGHITYSIVYHIHNPPYELLWVGEPRGRDNGETPETRHPQFEIYAFERE